MGKFTVQLTGDMDDVLTQLSEKQGIPKAQVVRRALGLLKYAQDQKEQNNLHLALTNDKQKVVTRIVQS
jgi:hypothetical protein